MNSIGFTGTQKGMTDAQCDRLMNILIAESGAHFHHGDCIGADEMAAAIAAHRGLITIAHPPSDSSKRAWARSESILPAKPYLRRNHDIVDASEVLIATPSGYKEQVRSGTWATIRYARKKGKPVLYIWPDGSFEQITTKESE